MYTRSIAKIDKVSWHQGFLGTGHKAAAILEGIPYQDSDPFILFMDDVLDLPGGEPVGGPHPHAGFETLTLVIEGNGKEWLSGSFEIMTAGKGIVHTEEIAEAEKMRILQVWLVLPPEKRWTQPSFQKILLQDVPKIKNDQFEIRVYSGESNGLRSKVHNHTPFTLVDYQIKKDSSVKQIIPSYYNGLIYVLDGSVTIGDQTVKQGQVAWLNKINSSDDSEIGFNAKDEDTRFVLYAGQPHHFPVVQYGPFVGDSMNDITRLYSEYRIGMMPHLNQLPSEHKINLSEMSETEV